jgi:predicted dehydrogenase
MTKRLRVGVIGLGKRWPRFRAALLSARNDYEIAIVHDASLARAEANARVLGCPRASGVLDLVDHADVDAVLLLDRQWWGQWPLEQAIRRGKPVLSCLGLGDEMMTDCLAEKRRHGEPAVLMGYPFAFAAALEQVHHLLADSLGRASLIRVHLALPALRRRGAELLRRPEGAAAVAVALGFLGGEVESVSAVAEEPGRLATLLLHAGDKLAQVNVWTAPGVKAACRVEVVAEQGTATALLPRRVRWQSGEDVYTRLLPRRPAAAAWLARFAEAIRTGQTPQPGIAEALQVSRCLQAARRSEAEGRRVSIGVSGATMNRG